MDRTTGSEERAFGLMAVRRPIEGRLPSVARSDAPAAIAIPSRASRPLITLRDDTRSMGIHIQAGRGSGKSRMMGRVIGWQDFVRGVPLVIFDPMGSTIDNLLDKISRLRAKNQIAIRAPWRIKYVDMAGGQHIVPFRSTTEDGARVCTRWRDASRPPWRRSIPR